MLQMYVIASGQRNNMQAFAKADIRLRVVMKKIYNFPEKSELPNQSSYLWWKLVGLLFPLVSEMEMKNLLRSDQDHFLVTRRCSISRLRLRALVLQRDPNRRLPFSVSTHWCHILMFEHISKYQEESIIYETQWSIFDELKTKTKTKEKIEN